mmetsp:Transcript_26285/g.4544  ORF Transcript_26285/g.4544 Transcript_26285/m.4544 type:complete len:182 (+) Transcript_26285:2148-2693(+)
MINSPFQGYYMKMTIRTYDADGVMLEYWNWNEDSEGNHKLVSSTPNTTVGVVPSESGDANPANHPDIYVADDWDFTLNPVIAASSKISGVIVIVPNKGYHWDILTAPAGTACGAAPYNAGYTLINSAGMYGLIWTPTSIDPTTWNTTFGLCATLRNRIYASANDCSNPTSIDTDCVVAYVS